MAEASCTTIHAITFTMVIGSTLCTVLVGFSYPERGIGKEALQAFSEMNLTRSRTDIRAMALTIVDKSRVGMF